MALTASGQHSEPKLDGEALVVSTQRIAVTDGLLTFPNENQTPPETHEGRTLTHFVHCRRAACLGRW